MSDILISPDELAQRLAAGERVRILDVRWRLDRPDGRPEYLAGHIPGAVYVDLDNELAEHGAPADGRHPLPSLERLQTAAQRWGIDPGDAVVVYDDLKSLSAARAWWLLTDAGIPDVRILDGSLRAWTDAGHPLEDGDVVPAIGGVALSRGRLATLAIDEAAELADDGVAARRAGARALPAATPSRSIPAPGTSPVRATCRPRQRRLRRTLPRPR